MAALPGTDWSEFAPEPNAIVTIRHVFTHFSLDLGIVAQSDPTGEGWWQPLDAISESGLPTLYRKAVQAVLADRDRLAA
jgi:A/G-specific adenine glycosylase